MPWKLFHALATIAFVSPTVLDAVKHTTSLLYIFFGHRLEFFFNVRKQFGHNAQKGCYGILFQRVLLLRDKRPKLLCEKSRWSVPVVFFTWTHMESCHLLVCAFWLLVVVMIICHTCGKLCAWKRIRHRLINTWWTDIWRSFIAHCIYSCQSVFIWSM